MNMKPGDIVMFGEEGECVPVRIVAIGFPITQVDYGPPMGKGLVFTGGITQYATAEEVEEFNKPANAEKGASMTRSEHLEWAKKRAIEYVAAGNLNEAVSSFMSDMQKHDELKSHPALILMAQLLFSGHLSDAFDVRKFISGFN